MDSLLALFGLTLIGSIVSMIGGVLLLFKKDFALRYTDHLAAFAAGSLLGAAFLDLLPEALEQGFEAHTVLLWTLLGILTFFLLERFIHWFHHHHEHVGEVQKPTAALIIFGDSLHNFIDGVAIAGTFLVDPALGVITTIAVGAHEIPQEIGDFGILLKAGYSRGRVLFYNALSACMALVGALITYFIGVSITGVLPILLAITAGFFMYIALSDLVPEIHAWGKRKLAITESMLLLAGVAVVAVAMVLLEGAH